jgi:sec-independent protein translocase protein TatC
MNGVPQTFFEHLEELRRRLILCLGAVAVSALTAFFFSDRILAFLIDPIRAEIGSVYFFSPAEAFVTKVQIACIVGALLASPLILTELWLFVTPALGERERRKAAPLIFVVSALFIAGVVFAYCSVMPVGLKFLIGQQTELLKPMISVEHYIAFIGAMLLAFGIAFNMPVFILALSWFGVLKASVLFRYHRHAVVLIFILAAVLTPGPDIASQLLLAVPLLSLFELSLLGAYLIEKARRKSKVRA